MKQDLSLSNSKKYYLTATQIKDLMELKPVKVSALETMQDTSTKAVYTNPAIATLCNFIIEKGFSSVVFEIEGTTSKGHNFINRGTCAETLINAIIDILLDKPLDHIYIKASKGASDLDISSIDYTKRKALGLTLDKGAIEIKYSNSNTKANACKNSCKSILLLTQNGFSIVALDKAIKDKNGKIFASSELNGRQCKTLNRLVGFKGF